MNITRDNFEQIKLAKEVDKEFSWNELSCVNSSTVIQEMPDYFAKLDALIESMLG